MHFGMIWRWRLKKGDGRMGKRDYSKEVPPGLSIGFNRTPQSSFDWNNKPHKEIDSPQVQLQVALGLAGVRIDGGIGGGSGQTIIEDSLTISIGAPVRDAYDVIQPINPFN
jgi:hypothetical protein